MMTETIGEWCSRKDAQGSRLSWTIPGHIVIDNTGDYHTEYVALDNDKLIAVVFGKLPWNGMWEGIDLTDDEVIALFEKQKVA